MCYTFYEMVFMIGKIVVFITGIYTKVALKDVENLGRD